MNNLPDDNPSPDDFDSLKPSERFARLAKTVLSVTADQIAQQEAKGRESPTGRKRGSAKGTVTWSTKRKLERTVKQRQPTA